MPLASWLFLKESQSIWIERPHGLTMLVAGPGPLREQREFANEDALQAYQIELAEGLTQGGWILWGINRERRQASREARAGGSTPERRRPPGM